MLLTEPNKYLKLVCFGIFSILKPNAHIYICFIKMTKAVNVANGGNGCDQQCRSIITMLITFCPNKYGQVTDACGL